MPDELNPEDEKKVEKPERLKKDEMTDLRFFEFTRTQIEHEDRLIDHRLTWLIGLQSFLFAAYGFSLSAESMLRVATGTVDKIALQQQADVINNARLAFAIMSFMSSIALLCGVAAAAASMKNLRDGWILRQGPKTGHYPQVIGEGLPHLSIYGGLIPTYFLPIATSIAWIWLEHTSLIAWLGFLLVLLCAGFGIICLVKRHTLCGNVFKTAVSLLRLRKNQSPPG